MMRDPTITWSTPCACIGIGLAVVIGTAVTVGMQGPMQDTVIKITPPRTAIDMEFGIDRDENGDIVKIHRFILWSNGDVTFPDLPYYASLRLNCRDCPKEPNPCPEDVDGNGKIGVPDMLLLQAKWGQDCP